jgi:dolichol-phosphate mannosyltransferase
MGSVLSIIIPTYNEKENIEELIKRIFAQFKEDAISGEVIIVDDNSKDGTGEIAEELKKRGEKIKVIHRAGKLGLSSAVLDGWKIAEGSILGVMDADLSHPPEKLKELYSAILQEGNDLAIGSRYIVGGKIEGWNFKRKIMSKSASLLARPFTRVKDPMTGFFLVKRECIHGKELNPKGFKILLEVLIKAECKKIKEVPITFINRQKGKSKASTKEIIYYLQNLLGYLPYKAKRFIKRVN